MSSRSNIQTGKHVAASNIASPTQIALMMCTTPPAVLCSPLHVNRRFGIQGDLEFFNFTAVLISVQPFDPSSIFMHWAAFADMPLRRCVQGCSYPPETCIKQELVAVVRRVIGPIATPDVIHWAPSLPKTRSGKIMRRILRKIASGYVMAWSLGAHARCICASHEQHEL